MLNIDIHFFIFLLFGTKEDKLHCEKRKENNPRMDPREPNSMVKRIYHLMTHNLSSWWYHLILRPSLEQKVEWIPSPPPPNPKSMKSMKSNAKELTLA
jgi:hypothetical protein